jgi:putative peptide zinc metalloprotease protein
MSSQSASPLANATGAAGEALEPRLRNVVVGVRRDLVVTRQIVRGGPRYVVHDPVTFRNHILTPLEYRILCALAADRSLGQIWDRVVGEGALGAEDAEEFYGFVVALHGMGLLQVPGMPVDTVWRRHSERTAQRRRGGPLRHLLSFRISLGDPDRRLQQLLPWVRWLFGPPGALLWSALLVLAAWECAGRLGELYGGAADLLALSNLPILWCSLVGLKVLHELGHAFAIKRFGGVVPDFGIVFIMLTPCAYVDANSSWTFAGRWPRIVVGLAGMYVETMIAAAAALVWAGTSPGFLHDVAQNVVVLASVTTVLINLNPLVKFDGYFVFSDLMGVVNLQERANRTLRGALERLLLGLPGTHEDLTAGERALAWAYAPASLVYRVTLAVSITALMATHWPAVGLALGLAFGWLLILDPVRRLFVHLWRGERTAPVRLRARLVASAAVMAVVFGAALLPVSFRVVAQGVLDPGVRRSVRAPGSAFVAAVPVAEGALATAGSVLCRLEDHQLEERLLSIEAELAVARIRVDTSEIMDPVFAAAAAARVEFLEKRAGELAARATALAVTVPDEGTVVGSRTVPVGSYVHQGQELMQVHSEHRFVRVVLTDQDVTRTRLQVGAEAEVRWTCEPLRSVRATVREIRRAASRHRVPVELTVAAGGQIYARSVGEEAEANQPYLHVFLEADYVPLQGAGGGLTASVQFAAREQKLIDWLRHGVFTFFHHWKMT